MKKEYNSLYCQLQQYFETIEEELDVLYYLKSALLIIVGVLSTTSIGLFIGGLYVWGVVTGIGSLFSFIGFVWIESKFRNRKTRFPIKILDHLNAQSELRSSNKELNRKKTIDKFIDNSIKALNLNTCNVAYEEDYEICKHNLGNGLSSVIDDIVNRTNYVLDTPTSKFSVGLYITNIAQKIDKYIPGRHQAFKDEFFVLRDDLGLTNYIPNDIENVKHSEGLKHNLQTKFSSSFNNNSFATYCIDIDDIGHTLIVSPIPSICETDSPMGLLFIVAEDDIQIKEYLESVLNIFGRILANWMDKYNQCVIAHADKLKWDETGVTQFINEVEAQDIECCPVPSNIVKDKLNGN